VDWNVVENDWEHFRDKVQGRWSRLKGDRLLAIAGKRAQLISAIVEYYGISEELAESQVQGFELRHRDYRPWTSSCSRWRLVK